MGITHFIRGCVSGALQLLRMTKNFSLPVPAVATALCCALCAVAPAAAAEAPRKNYDLPGGDAAATLKRFAADSGEQIVFMIDTVRGVKTNAVKGEFTAREVLERMVSNTGLVVVRDDKTGALMINRVVTNGRQSPDAMPPPQTRAAEPKTLTTGEARNFLTRLAAALALLAAPGTHAADAAAATEKPAEAIRLSPFTVSTDKDTGYMAADTMTGGMLATNLLKTATDVTVLTRDFLDDIGASNLQEAQLWLTSSDIGGSSALATNPTDFGIGAAFRGLAATGNMRNYFRHAFTPEEYVVERIEGSRGPNGILYGDALQGGKANFLTKRASFARNFTSARVRLDTYGGEIGRGFYLDVNRALTSNWAARVNLQLKKGPQWYDYSFDDHRGVALATTYRPWRGAEVRFEAEKNFIRTSNYRPDALTDGSSLWDRVTTVGAPLTAAPGGGVTRLTTNTFVYIQGLGVQNWINFGKSTGTGLTLFPTNAIEGRDTLRNFPVTPSQRFNINAYNDRNESHNTDYNLTLEQKFDSGLVFEVAGDHNSGIREGDTLYSLGSFIDVNRVLPDGRVNPNFGQVFSEQNFNTNPIRTADYYSGARVAVAYPIRTPWFSQIVSVVAQYREHLSSFKSWQYFRDNGALAPTGLTTNALDQNQSVRIWRYWNSPGGEVALPESDAVNKYRWVFSRDRHTNEHLGSLQANTIGSYFHDTLTFVGGVRRDLYHAADRDIARRDPVTGAPTFATGLATDAAVNTTTAGIT